MKFGEKLGWYSIALTVIVGVISYSVVFVCFATGEFGYGEKLIAHADDDQWSINVSTFSHATAPNVTFVTAEEKPTWWAREREILWIRLMADSAKITFLPMDSVEVSIWFNEQKRNYLLSLRSETMVRDTFDLKNKNRPE